MGLNNLLGLEKEDKTHELSFNGLKTEQTIEPTFRKI